MLDDEQARAYATADFACAHARYPRLFAERFPDRPKLALVLDLGCGAADVTIRFARANPGYLFHAVDGSAAMLKYARGALTQAGLTTRIKLIKGVIPHIHLPCPAYDVIISTSFLHHLHEPDTLWSTIRRYSRPGTLVFVVDLMRPRAPNEARRIVEKYSAAEPPVLKRDFFNSLCAAFTPAEVRTQLCRAGLSALHVQVVSDRHFVVFGRIPARH